MNWNQCWLSELGGCSNIYHRHHLISKGAVRGVKKTEAFKASLNLLLVPICSNHNISKIADTPANRKILLKKLRDLYGEDWCRWAINQVLEKTKVRSAFSDLEYDAIMGYEDEEIILEHY